MPPPPERIVLSAAGVDLTIAPEAGARAVSWRVDGHELLAHRSANPVEGGMYPMAPWAGRIRDNTVVFDGQRHDLPVTYAPWALHGTVLARPATTVDVTQTAEAQQVVARFGEHPGWPWPAEVEVTWELRGRTVLTSLAVHALEQPFPAVVGWHPWFRRSLDVGQPARWTVEATERLVRGDDHLPTGAATAFHAEDGPFDDAFTVPTGRAGIIWPGAFAMDIDADGGWYVVFDEFPDALCLEPQSGPPDGLIDAGRPPAYGPLKVARPGSPVTLRTTWTIRADEG